MLYTDIYHSSHDPLFLVVTVSLKCIYKVYFRLVFQRRWDAYGHKSTSSRWWALQRLRLHQPNMMMQKQQQGIAISLEMGSMEYLESYPLQSSEPLDFFSDPMSLESDREGTSLPGEIP